MSGVRAWAFFLGGLAASALAAPITDTVSATVTLAIPNKYIVTLKNATTKRELDDHVSWVSGVHKRLSGIPAKGVSTTYDISNFKGYAGEFDDATLKTIKANPLVAAIEPDQVVSIAAMTTQSAASWGLTTISNRASGKTQYYYDNSAGSGGYAYVLDTGILTTHSQFGGRASNGFNAVGGKFVDDNGHGTHVAGTIAGSTYGVAKRANVIAVKVLDKSAASSISVVLNGFTWAVNDIKSKGRQSKAIINMSLSTGYSSAFNTAVNAAYTSGVITVVAAGNTAENAAKYSPASAVNAVTVGALNNNWRQSSYSNYGSAVDIFAPGSNIPSAWYTSNTAINTLTGTSMASPHVAGLILYLRTLENLKTPATTISRLKALATSGKISGLSSGSPNLIAYNGSGK